VLVELPFQVAHLTETLVLIHHLVWFQPLLLVVVEAHIICKMVAQAVLVAVVVVEVQ
jgi:hypothetical protein